MFDSLADTILLGENQCKKNDILRLKQYFQWAFGWNQVKYARKNITHFCFVAFTLAGSLGRLKIQMKGHTMQQFIRSALFASDGNRLGFHH